MIELSMDSSGMDDMGKVIDEYGKSAYNVINDVLHGEGEKVIEEKIKTFLPESGRTFKGHTAGAKSSQPFTHDDDMLEVTVAARGKWGYLYFPDDGSNTKKHAGNQHFMQAGADAAVNDIIDIVVDKLINAMEV